MKQSPRGLDRFLAAQASVYADVLLELRSGQKRSHWMWFIFPQLRGLGQSTTARFYGIESLQEAKDYMRHPTLGTRLLDCTALTNQIQGRTAREIFSSPDDLKFRSCLTLFSQTTAANDIFVAALKHFYQGKPDPTTLDLLNRSTDAPK